MYAVTAAGSATIIVINIMKLHRRYFKDAFFMGEANLMKSPKRVRCKFHERDLTSDSLNYFLIFPSLLLATSKEKVKMTYIKAIRILLQGAGI